MRTSGVVRVLLAVSGGIVLILCPWAPVLLPYPLFVLAYLLGWRLPVPGPPWFRLLTAAALCTLLLETTAWLDNFLRNDAEPALFHPQLIPDLVLSVGVYSAWWLVWWLALRFFRFTAAQVFIVTGLYGVLIEQGGAVFIAGLETLPLGTFLWAFVAIAYGSTMALACFLVRDSFSAVRAPWWRFPVVAVALYAGTLATSLLWGLLLLLLRYDPPKLLPMQDYPFW